MATNSIIVDGSTGGINTNVVRVISQTTPTADVTINAEANKGYILTHTSLQTVNLPSSPAVSDVVYLQGFGTGLFKVAQAANEQIILGDKSTTVGVTGFVDSTNAGDSIYLICVDTSGAGPVWANNGGYGGNLLIDGVTPADTINSTLKPAAYGSLYKSLNTDSESLSNEVWKLWNAGTFNSGLLVNFTRGTGSQDTRLTYTGSVPRTFCVTLNCTQPGNPPSAFFDGAIYYNGSIMNESYFSFRSTNNISVNSGNAVTITMSNGDYVEPWFQAYSNVNLEFYCLRMAAFPVDGQ